ncbi:MAG: ORF6N domain-containing protein [Bacteroidota bacterium]
MLAELYLVETKVLNQQVNRNPGKFPERYMFQLTQDEHDRLRSQNVTLKRGQHLKYLPYAFIAIKLQNIAFGMKKYGYY